MDTYKKNSYSLKRIYLFFLASTEIERDTSTTVVLDFRIKKLMYTFVSIFHNLNLVQMHTLHY